MSEVPGRLSSKCVFGGALCGPTRHPERAQLGVRSRRSPPSPFSLPHVFAGALPETANVRPLQGMPSLALDAMASLGVPSILQPLMPFSPGMWRHTALPSFLVVCTDGR